MRACRLHLLLSNKVLESRPNTTFQVEISTSRQNGSNESPQADKLNATTSQPSTPLKAMLLSQSPYQANSVERNKLINLHVQLHNRFKIPCRQTMRSAVVPQKVTELKFKIINYYNLCWFSFKANENREKLRNLLNHIGHCSLTCDSWPLTGIFPIWVCFHAKWAYGC